MKSKRLLGPDRFVANGRDLALETVRTEIAGTIRDRHAAELAGAGFIRRLWLEHKIRQEIERELEKPAPKGALYGASVGRRGGNDGVPQGNRGHRSRLIRTKI